jgi:hypothetical protein
MPDRDKLEGGCLCRAIRYRLLAPPQHVVHCHCSLCRRAAGAPMVSWATMREGDFTMLAGVPVWFRSSDHGKRAFCVRCGTQLFFVSTRYPGVIDVTAASLDRPELIRPDAHTYEPDRIAWLVMADKLPRHVEDSGSPAMPSGAIS